VKTGAILCVYFCAVPDAAAAQVSTEGNSRTLFIIIIIIIIISVRNYGELARVY
jgi:hypothetical protein